MTLFQSAASRQGRQFAEQCDGLLEHNGYQLSGSVRIPDLGVEVDRAATSPNGRTIWFEYKGSLQGRRPGLLRTDTLKKAIANGALLQGLADHPPFVVLTSHLPTQGAGLGMLTTARRLGYFSDVICIYDPAQLPRLATL
jgi:hypothetical protein